MKNVVALTLAILAYTCPPAKAEIFEPFTTTNMNPFVQVNGPPVTRSALTAARRELRWQLRTDVANNFTSSSSNEESVTIDGETHRRTLSLRYGLTDRLEVGIDIPHVSHKAGSLDQFIEQWHGFWGLPNSGRDRQPQDQLSFDYSATDGTAEGLSRSAAGIGDVRLHAGYQFAQSENRTWALRGGVKLATGDADKLTGSESTDLFASVHLSQSELAGRSSLMFHGSMGLLRPGDSRVLRSRTEDWITYGSAAISWQVRQRISLKAQVDFHSAYYDSSLEELGDPAMQLMVGGSMALGEKLLLDLSLAEDILTDRSPDVVFQLGLRSNF